MASQLTPFSDKLLTSLQVFLVVREKPAQSVLLLTLLCLFSCNQAWSQQLTRDQYNASIKEISEQIKSVSGRLNENQKLLKGARDQLSLLEQKIQETTRLQSSAKKKIAEHGVESERIEQQIEALSKAQEEDIEALSELVRARHKQGNPNYLKLLLNQENPHAAGRLSHYYQYFTAAQREKLLELRGELQEIRNLQSQALNTAEALQAEQDSLQKRTTELTVLRQERARKVAVLNEKVSGGKSELARLNADRDRLNNLLAALAKQAERLRKLEEQRREQERRAAAARAKPAPLKPTSRPPVAGGFKKQQGRLPAPVSAPLQYAFGARLASSGMKAQGHFYQTQQEQPVAAIFRGNVLFADYLKGYGLLMIIDHGDDHISLYGHNEVLYKRVGDSVTNGEVIAQSGVSGGLRQPGLYFEIRHQATPVDPTKWLSR